MVDLEGWKCVGCGETVHGQDGMDKHICKDEIEATKSHAPSGQAELPGSVAIKIGAGTHTGKEEVYCSWFKCPKCKKDWLRRGFDYCPMCGVKIVFDL